jgi:hypothetical protein
VVEYVYLIVVYWLLANAADIVVVLGDVVLDFLV